MCALDPARRADRHRREQRARGRQREPRELPAVHGVDDGQRHQHGGRDDAPSRAAVIEAEDEARIARTRRRQPRRQHAPADENRRAARAGDHAHDEQRVRVREQPAARHQDDGQRAAGAEQRARRPAAREPREGQRAQQIAERIGGVHRASQGEGPAEVELHRRQKQRVCEAGKPERDRAAERERGSEHQRGDASRGVGGGERRGGVEGRAGHGVGVNGSDGLDLWRRWRGFYCTSRRLRPGHWIATEF
jgi:hypothetical protein